MVNWNRDWAAPIVIVKKKDGGIRICADFKMTVNPQLRPKTYPLPTLDEVFAALAQGLPLICPEHISKWK